MKKIIFIMVMFLAAISTQAQKFVITDGNAEMRKVSEFSGVRVSSAIDLYISQGDEIGVAVSASDTKVRDRIRTEVKDGVLKIWFDGSGWNDWKGNKHMKAYVSVKTLNMIKADGACDVELMGKIKTDKLSIDLGGASDLSGQLDCGELDMDINGASDTKLTGNVGSVSVRLNGASSIKGWGLVTDFCDIDANGASSINVTVNKEMKVKASGASDINYKGTGVIREMKSSGASSINRKDG
jgi:Putative auto-transporter adhesin, head GIN domain